MFTQIRTSKKNKEVVTKLTQKFGLRKENAIARIALAFSLEHDGRLDLSQIQDSGGKEYSRKVLFGENEDFYLGILCEKYQISKSSPDISRYTKAHIDNGLSGFNRQNESLMQLVKL